MLLFDACAEVVFEVVDDTVAPERSGRRNQRIQQAQSSI